MAYRTRVITRSVRALRCGTRRDHSWHACAPSVSSCVESSGGVAAGPARDENGGVRGSGGGGSRSSSAALGEVGERHRSCDDGRSSRRSRAGSPHEPAGDGSAPARVAPAPRRGFRGGGMPRRSWYAAPAPCACASQWPCASEGSDRRGGKGGVRWRGSPPPLNPLCCPRAASDSGLRESKME